MVVWFVSFIILAQIKNNNILTAHSIYVDVTNYVFYFQLGYIAYIRTKLLIPVGRNDKEEYLKIRKKLYCYSLSSLAFILLVWVVTFKELTRLYSNNRIVLEYVNLSCFMQPVNIILEHHIVLFSAFLKIIGKERLQLMISLWLFVPLYVIIQYILVLVLLMDIYGCRLSSQIAIAIYLIVLICLYFHYEKRFLIELDLKQTKENELAIFEDDLQET